MEYGQPNINECEPWSRMDLCDLTTGLAQGTPVAEIADFLCRSEKEVREKIAELGQANPKHEDAPLARPVRQATTG